MGMNRMHLVFLENLEWFDDTGDKLVQRIPEEGSGEIKYGAQLTVRDNQTAVFYYKGKALEAFGPGRHTLQTGNIPILTKIASLPWGLSSPLRAEVHAGHGAGDLAHFRLALGVRGGRQGPGREHAGQKEKADRGKQFHRGNDNWSP